MTYDWSAIVSLHRERGCAFDGVRYTSHTCANATRGKTLDREPLPEYVPATVPDAPEIQTEEDLPF